MHRVAILLSALLISAGCVSNAKPSMSANTHCPVMPDLTVDGATFVEWNGIKVGFCCAECIDRWDRMTEPMKHEAFERAR